MECWTDFPWQVRDSVSAGVHDHPASGGEALADAVVVLHGFTGSGEIHFRMFQNDPLFAGLRPCVNPMRIVAPDLPGHGGSANACTSDIETANADGSPYTLSSQIRILHRIITTLRLQAPAQRIHLLGYSMGSRLALAYTLNHPNQVQTLTLESCNPGIASPTERRDRVLRDAQLANALLHDYATFLSAWNRLPLFASPADAPEQPAKLFHQIQQKQRPDTLAASLREFSTGHTPDFSTHLHRLSLPVLILTGSLDQTYTHRWHQLQSQNPHLRHVIIAGAGHRVHLDRPDAYIDCLQHFIAEQNTHSVHLSSSNTNNP